MIEFTGKEVFCPSVGARPGMYFNQNICGMYDLILEMIATCAVRCRERMSVTLINEGGLNVAILINADNDVVYMSERRKQHYSPLEVFNALYCGGWSKNFEYFMSGSPIIMASKSFKLQTNGESWTIDLPDDVNKNDPNQRIVHHAEVDPSLGGSIYWAPDFTRFHYFDGKIIPDFRSDTQPCCHFEDEDITKSYTKRNHSGIHTETIDRGVVQSIIDMVYEFPQIKDKLIITLF
jgi:hypothetical protein